MPTSLHIPKPLLDEVERRAKHLKVSRNRYIVSVLENEVSRGSMWSPGFLQMLGNLGEEGIDFAEILDETASHRRSKTPVRF